MKKMAVIERPIRAKIKQVSTCLNVDRSVIGSSQKQGVRDNLRLGCQKSLTQP